MEAVSMSADTREQQVQYEPRSPRPHMWETPEKPNPSRRRLSDEMTARDYQTLRSRAWYRGIFVGVGAGLAASEFR